MKFYQGMGHAHRDYVVAIRSGLRRTRQNATAQHGIKSTIWRQAIVSAAVHCGLIALPAVLQRPPLIFSAFLNYPGIRRREKPAGSEAWDSWWLRGTINKRKEALQSIPVNGLSDPPAR